MILIMIGSGKLLPSREDEEMLFSIFHVSRETLDLLQIYVDLLAEWQAKTNLVSNSTLAKVWRRHICDSLQCAMILPEKRSWLDIGTGAGFPGLVLAIVGRQETDFDVQLVESNGKKCAFLKKVIRETGASASVSVNRIEAVTHCFVDRDVVTARALKSLDNLFDLTLGWFDHGAVGLFPKGRNYAQELEKCRGRWEFDLIKHRSRIEENSVLLEIHNLRKSDL